MLRGGQGDDSIVAGSGPEWISGDRGDDTIQAGSGPDTFHTFSGAGSTASSASTRPRATT
ncbi:MAG: hypothetical protein KGO51_16020 [Alphaproteobacteria bacterium]|nr:hypothetical protein [Alphaproteobacteria bacterium]